MKLNMKTLKRDMLIGAAGTGLALMIAGCTETTPPPSPQQHTMVSTQKGVAGGTVVNTTKIYAKVVRVDSSDRNVTLMDAEGNTFDVKAGPAAVNLDQVKPGDLVKVTLTQQLVVSVNPKGTVTPEAGAGLVALAPKGAPAGGIVAGTRTVTATLIAMDIPGRVATLKFSNGNIRNFPVRPDVDMAKYKVGQQVVVRLTEMVAIDLEKPQMKEKSGE
jgi:hypothetical protein